MANEPKEPQPNFYISRETFSNLIGPGFWRVNEVPRERWGMIGWFFAKGDTLAVFASGVAPTLDPSRPRYPAGIDWVKIENNQKPGEPPLNVYHYVIGHPSQYGYPVFGPFGNGAIAPHWSQLANLDPYFTDNRS